MILQMHKPYWFGTYAELQSLQVKAPTVGKFLTWHNLLQFDPKTLEHVSHIKFSLGLEDYFIY